MLRSGWTLPTISAALWRVRCASWWKIRKKMARRVSEFFLACVMHVWWVGISDGATTGMYGAMHVRIWKVGECAEVNSVFRRKYTRIRAAQN